ncbi:hypothetical protein V6Z98_006977 [Aspergillus fumigatus]
MEMLSTIKWKDDEYYCEHPLQKRLRDVCVERVNWEALCQYASSKNSGRPCSLLEKSTIGGVHLIRLLSFGDAKWIARVQLRPSTPETASLLRAEIDAMELVRARTDIPVPRVFGFELDDANPVRAAFILMDFLPGSSAMDAEGGYDAHRGEIPPRRKAFFLEQIAKIQVQLSSIRLPKIGSIVRRDDNSFDVGPLPKLGGPFSTATEFFNAWAKHAKFPLSDDDIKKLVNGGPIDSILSSINAFPDRLREVACRVSANNSGPFPLYHPDFYHSNVIVDESFKVLGVIDWEGACTVPWELVEPPLFLGIVPPAMDDPKNYEADGQPKDCNIRRRLSERAEYAEYVQKKEEEFNGDRKLSQILLNPDAQGLAHAIKVYHDPGKLGFYCRVLDPFSPES